MGLISRETASGSIKLAYSSPVTSGQIVLGKYLAAIGFGCCLMLVPIASAIYGSLVIPSFDWAPVLVALLGLYLLICAYCAIGLFMSSLTTYQVVAAVGTLIVLAILNFVGNIGQEYDFIRELTYWLSINGRTIDMLNGVIRSEDVIYFVVVVTLFPDILPLSNLHPTDELSVVSGKQSVIWDFLSQQWQLAISLHVRE